ncbi:MAG: hybrid sensor histidine kinase/response regulator [Burkholderiaceae bacterium]
MPGKIRGVGLSPEHSLLMMDPLSPHTEPQDARGPLTRFGLGLESRAQRAAAVQAGVLAAVFRQVPASLLGNLAGAALLVVVLWGAIPQTWLAGWFGLAALESWLRLCAARAFTVDPDRVERIGVWLSRWVALAAGAGAVWGLAGYGFFISGSPLQQLLVVVLVLGVSFGSLPLYAGWRRAFDLFMSLALLPLVLRMAAEQDPAYYMAAAVVLVVFAFALLFGRRFGATVRESVKNDFENELLVKQLLAEKQLAEEARRAAESATRARSQFFAAASHDLRQPLQAIGIYVSLLRKRAEAGALPLVNNLSSSVESLSKLVEELLEISRLDSGAIQPRIEQVGVEDLFNTLEQEFAPIAGARGLSLRVRQVPRALQTDVLLLQRVLRNLLANAIRYTNRGGVLLAARVRSSGTVMIEVWDTGAGIAAVEGERIFEEFYRGESSKVESSGAGFGLGLSIVRRICGLLRLPLSMSSRPGRGTVFRIELPASLGPRRLGRSAPDAPHWLLRPLQGVRVALIEDNLEIRNSLARLLRSWGALEISASGYNAALIRGLSMHDRIDVILADQNLGPHSPSGVETVFRMREVLGFPVPAIILTAVPASEVLAEFARVMRDRLALNPTLAEAIVRSRVEEPIVLQKPTTPAVLNNAIVVQLGGVGATSATSESQIAS